MDSLAVSAGCDGRVGSACPCLPGPVGGCFDGDTDEAAEDGGGHLSCQVEECCLAVRLRFDSDPSQPCAQMRASHGYGVFRRPQELTFPDLDAVAWVRPIS